MRRVLTRLILLVLPITFAVMLVSFASGVQADPKYPPWMRKALQEQRAQQAPTESKGAPKAAAPKATGGGGFEVSSVTGGGGIDTSSSLQAASGLQASAKPAIR
jgi:hypothetical protein